MMLPEKDDYLFFPRQAGQLVMITWYQNYQYCEAEYYRTPAFVFRPTAGGGLETGKGTKYETVLFIARERFDDLYYFVPPALSSLQDHHVRRLEPPASKNESEEAQAIRTNWIQCKIDEKFFYGQDNIKDPTYRWLVFHPAERQPAQGRFIEAKPQLIVGNVISILPSVQTPTGGLTINFDEATAKNVQSWGVRLFGHKLHQFGKPEVNTLELDEKTLEKIGIAAKTDLFKGTKQEGNTATIAMGMGALGMGTVGKGSNGKGP
ncbi:hypothetical protein G6011_10113 [Alternaria panax]|uniref:Uncharacterized protein n=1 Tax=Alternaria panax TaxID=48097 RepID=A0AAD4I2Z7_9PLEO|nr:hypothetical protein G6011_10113 [Alternaria panax]